MLAGALAWHRYRHMTVDKAHGIDSIDSCAIIKVSQSLHIDMTCSLLRIQCAQTDRL